MRQMRRNRLAFICLVLLLFIATPPVRGTNLESLEELEAFLDGIFAIQLGQYHVPGITVAVVKDGALWFSKGYGFADLDKKTPMNPETTLHRPGSNSKILVWTAVMQLVEQGRLDLYADISTYLDFSIPTKLKGGKEAPPITLHHLLTHTAGFEDELSQVFVSDSAGLMPLGQYVRNHLPARVFTPGRMMAYSNYGTTLAAYVVELASGQPFAKYVAEHIFVPLQMDSSTFVQPLPQDLAPRMSAGYRYVRGQYIPADFEYVQSYPAGGLTSSTNDMAKLIILHLGLGSFGDEQIINEETAKLMQTQQFAGHSEIPGMTYGFIETDYNGHRVLSHGGDTLLFTTGFYFLPKEQVGLYVAYNSPIGELARRSLFEGFMDRYFQGDGLDNITPRPVAAGTEGHYSGVYHSARSNYTGPEIALRLLQSVVLSLDEDGYLLLQSGEENSRYGEIAPGLFQEINGKDKIAFTFQDGKVHRIHVAGPFTLLRTPWYQNITFVGALLGISILVMLVSIVGWIRQLFRPHHKRRPFAVPKILGILFFVIFVTIVVLSVDTITDLHPSLGIPMLFLESSTTLKTAFLFTKLLIGLNLLMVFATIYIWLTTKGSLWQRIYYTLLTMSAASVVWVFWQYNFF